MFVKCGYHFPGHQDYL